MLTAHGILTALLLIAGYAMAYEIDGNNYCVGRYALCAGSPCQPINSTYAICQCEMHYGLNNAQSSCQQRAHALISTYSIFNLYPSASQPMLYSFPCEGDNAGTFAQCGDAPCTTSADNTSACTCPLRKGNNHYLGPKCPTSASETKALCASLRSSGMSRNVTSGHASKRSSASGLPGPMEEQIQAAFYGPQPTRGACAAPGASG